LGARSQGLIPRLNSVMDITIIV
jgi:hypothetical protein